MYVEFSVQLTRCLLAFLVRPVGRPDVAIDDTEFVELVNNFDCNNC